MKDVGTENFFWSVSLFDPGIFMIAFVFDMEAMISKCHVIQLLIQSSLIELLRYASYLCVFSGSVWFASEMKAVSDDCERFISFPPGHIYSSKSGMLFSNTAEFVNSTFSALE